MPLEELVVRLDRFQQQLRQSRAALMAFVDHGTRWPRLPLAAAVIAGSLVLPGTATGTAPPTPADQALHLYEHLAGDPGALQLALTPDYEIGLGGVVYGPVTGLPVPWDLLVHWAQSHPPEAVIHTQAEAGWRFAVIRVQGGYAYLVYTAGGEVAKLHLASAPEAWDG